MSYCNDPKCPLNRQGVLHEDHELIENKPVKNPCNDPRCAMNRMGISHEIHDGKQTDYEESKQTGKSKQFVNDTFFGSASDALHELGKQVQNENSTRISREKILAERRKRERQTIEQEAREVRRRENLKKQPLKSKIFSRSKSEIPHLNQILYSNDHYEIFNISQEPSCEEIKSKYKELSKNYNATRGSVNRTSEEQERLTKAQSKINIAYDFLRKKHCG